MLNPINVLREATAQILDADVSSDAANTLISAANYLRMSLEARNRRYRRNLIRRARHQAMLDCGLVRGRVNGKTFYE